MWASWKSQELSWPFTAEESFLFWYTFHQERGRHWSCRGRGPVERLPETSLLSAYSKPIDSKIAFQQLIRVDLCMASHSSPFPLGPGCAQENSLILESNSAPGTRTWTWFSLLVIPCGWRTWSHHLISVSQSQTLLLTRPPALRLKSGEWEWCKQSHTFPLY